MFKKVLVFIMIIAVLFSSGCNKSSEGKLIQNDRTEAAHNSLSSPSSENNKTTPKGTPDTTSTYSTESNSETNESTPSGTESTVQPENTANNSNNNSNDAKNVSKNNPGNTQNSKEPAKSTPKPQTGGGTKVPAPKNLRSVSLADGEGVFVWTDGSGKYQVRISEDGKNFKNYGGVISDKFITIKGLQPNKYYYIRVYSVTPENKVSDQYATIQVKYSYSKIDNDGGNNNSNDDEHTYANIYNESVFYGRTDAFVYWTGGIGKYQVKISTDNKNFSNYGGYINENYCTLENLKEGTTYYVRIYNVEKNNKLSSKFGSLSFTTLKLTSPTNVKVTQLGTTSATISWDKSDFYHHVYYSTNGKDFEEIGYTIGNSMKIEYLQYDTKYWVRVYTSEDYYSLSDKYTTIEFTTEKMAVPTTLNVSSIGQYEATISWVGGTGKYMVLLSDDGKTFYSHRNNITSKSLKITNLKSNTKYWVRVHSISENKESKAYALVSFTTRAKAAPNNLALSYLSPHGAILRWSAGSNDSNLLKISTNGKDFKDYDDYINNNYKALTGLKDNTKYWVRVYSVDTSSYPYVIGDYAETTFTTKKERSLVKLGSNYTTFLSSNNKKHYIQIDLQTNSIDIKGTTTTNYKRLWVRIMKGNSKVHEAWINISNSGSFSSKINVNLANGDYRLEILYGPDSNGMYWSMCLIDIFKKAGKMYFVSSPIYDTNYKAYLEGDYFPIGSVELNLNATDKKKITDLATNITKGISNDYDKVFAISKWVSENIYYNWDGYRSGNYGKTDAIGTLENKMSVCQGYAELTAALLKSINIPCKIVTGYAMGVSTDADWSNVGANQTNHAWNEAYVDGRWIIIDTTWNSRNKYENGKFIKEQPNYKYFDITLEHFSYTHRIGYYY